MGTSDGTGEAPGAEPPGESMSERGGCLKLGWGCLPVVVGLVLVVPARVLY